MDRAIATVAGGEAKRMTEVDSILERLNPRQREAVSYCEGPLLVLAGAGSGKTRVLAHKIAYLIASGKASPQGILAVTFTNKAAREMSERVQQLVGPISRMIQVSTFHAFGLKFLFRNHEALESTGVRKGFVVFDRGDTKGLIRDIMTELNLDSKDIEPATLLENVSRIKNEMNPLDMQPPPGLIDSVTGPVFKRYQERLREHNALDFDDLLVLPLHLLVADAGVRERERQRLQWILVDEYQDVNRIQYQLLRYLAGKRGAIMVVGDPDQSIYGWRGADMSMILNFEKDFPPAKVCVLDQNYRSTGNILAGANALILGNSNRRKKELWTVRDSGERIRVLLAPDETVEATSLVSEILRLHNREHYDFGDIAILYRINAMSRIYEQKLMENLVPYRVIRGTAFYERKEVKDVLSFMRLAANPLDRVSLMRAGNVPVRGLGKKSLEKLADTILSFPALPPSDIWRLVSEGKSGLASKAALGASELATHMAAILERSRDVGEIIAYILEDLGYAEFLREQESETWEDRVENVRELTSLVPSGGDLSEMLAEASLFTDLETTDMSDRNSVNLLTLHAAKGLEFPVIFLVGLEEGIFPHFRSLDVQDSLEEERRLCYVGMTRAEERLNMSGAKSRRLFGSTMRNGYSRFFWEIPDQYKVVEDRSEEERGDVRPGYRGRRWGW